MNYRVQKYEISELPLIRNLWQSLEIGEDMTYFQSYHWNSLLTQGVPVLKGVECGYYVVYKGEIPVMIAPLWIVTKRINLINDPGVFFIGRKSFSDYLNLIYSSFDPQAFAFLVKFISGLYGPLKWTFEELKETSSLFRFLFSEDAKKYGKLTDVISHTPCPLLTVSDTLEDYNKRLSKNTRQNIRTGWNRAKKDGIEFEINYDDKNIDKQECIRIRDERTVRQWKPVTQKISFKRKLKFLLLHRMLKKTVLQFSSFLPFIGDDQSRVMTIKDNRTGNIAAFFNYGLDRCHNEVVIMSAGVNTAYARYSPGMLLMKSYIDDITNNKLLLRVDFTRGEEPYKMSLGAKPQYNLSFEYSFNTKKLLKAYNL